MSLRASALPLSNELSQVGYLTCCREGLLPSIHTEEDVYGSYSRLLMKYFLSEGVMCGHTLLLASANERTEDILKVNESTRRDKC